MEGIGGGLGGGGGTGTERVCIGWVLVWGLLLKSLFFFFFFFFDFSGFSFSRRMCTRTLRRISSFCTHMSWESFGGWGVGCPAHAGIGPGVGHAGGGRDEQVVMCWRPDRDGGSSSAYALSMQGQPFESTHRAWYDTCNKLASHITNGTR